MGAGKVGVVCVCVWDQHIHRMGPGAKVCDVDSTLLSSEGSPSRAIAVQTLNLLLAPTKLL